MYMTDFRNDLLPVLGDSALIHPGAELEYAGFVIADNCCLESIFLFAIIEVTHGFDTIESWLLLEDDQSSIYHANTSIKNLLLDLLK